MEPIQTKNNANPDLLGPNDPPVFTLHNEEGACPLLLICDHASNQTPESLGALGLPSSEFDRHIAWDIGAADVVKLVAGALDAPAILAGYSRLLIDLNRHPGDPTTIPRESDGVMIPANQDLSEEEERLRVETFFTPYHHEVSTRLAHIWRVTKKPPALFSIHSFTPEMGGEKRIWDAGVLWNRDPRIARPLLDILHRQPDLTIGNNEPYSGLDIAYSIDRHAGAAGLPNCAIEIRQDHLSTLEGIQYWAFLIAEALDEILQTPDLHKVEVY